MDVMQHDAGGRSHEDRLRAYLVQHPVVRPLDVEQLGIPREYLLRMYRQGEVSRAGRGIYIHNQVKISEHHSLAEVSKRSPGAVVCLLSALAFHGITTQLPRAVWICMARNARKPRMLSPELRVVRTSRPAFDYGIEIHPIEGVEVRVSSPARTVADCFQFRNKVGMDVAVEALRECLRQRKATRAEFFEAARCCRMSNVIRPYLEALS